jgi:hypothetical protein
LYNINLSNVGVRLATINKKVTTSVSFHPSEAVIRSIDFYSSPTLRCLEQRDREYPLYPSSDEASSGWNIYAYDESVQNYMALEGDLMFCSSALVKLEDKYSFDLEVSPYFLTRIQKFEHEKDDAIRYNENFGEERNLILVTSKTKLILEAVEPHSIVLIDGPLIGGNASSYIEAMDAKLRQRDCVPVYFVKNSDSRLIVDNERDLRDSFNSDLHWAAHHLSTGHRSAFFHYTDQINRQHSKVFTYLKPLGGLTQRLEMHYRTYQRYRDQLPWILNLVAYLYLAQGDPNNPQVRPIAIAEKYAREGLRLLNIPARLISMGFHPTMNQVRFG